MHKKTILIDFDGVIHSYASGWKGIDIIPDPPVPGAIEFIKNLIQSDKFEVCIYSSRSKNVYAIVEMQNWLKKSGLKEAQIEEIKFPTEKPPAFLTIDDRCICFNGKFPSIEEIANFKPWYRKDAIERDDRITDFLEFDTETGKPHYLHSPTCEGGCDFDCMGQSGFDWAEKLYEYNTAADR